MLFRQIEVKGLSHYSYALGGERTRQLAIVDPKRDVDDYLRLAAEHGMRITHVFETHIHADYASGARELASRSGATLCASGHDRGEMYEVAHPHRDLADGQTVEIGTIRVQALHTPGHTPEHLSFLVSTTEDGPGVSPSRSNHEAGVSPRRLDSGAGVSPRRLDSGAGASPRRLDNGAGPSQGRPAAADRSPFLLSGDFLFVGSLGRPDLLGEDAKRRLAGQLFDSVRSKLAGLPDGMRVYPAHGAGSMCGAGMADQAFTTLGEQRLTNPYLDPALTRETFVERILAFVPPFPPYYRRMKQLNADGPAILETIPGTAALETANVRRLTDDGATVVDLRGQLEFGAADVPAALGIGAGNLLPVWAAWVVPYDRPIVLVADDPAAIEPSARALARVGLDSVRGHLRGGMAAWRQAGLPVETTPQTSPEQLHQRLARGEPLRVLDVRGDAEFAAGHVDGALHIMCGHLEQRIAELTDDGRPLAVTCGGGYRSTVAASVLARHGFQGVMNVTGGMGAWQRAGLPTVP